MIRKTTIGWTDYTWNPWVVGKGFEVSARQ